MRRNDEQLNDIYDRTDGCCHICGRKVHFKNYGIVGARGAWEIEHSKARVRGGTNHGNNLFPACISCNRSKGAGSTRLARGFHGRIGAPLTKEKKQEVRKDNAIAGGGIGLLGALALGATGPVGILAGAVGAALGYDREPDPQKGKRRR